MKKESIITIFFMRIGPFQAEMVLLQLESTLLQLELTLFQVELTLFQLHLTILYIQYIAGCTCFYGT